MAVLAYHPGTGHAVLMDEGQLALMRGSGWVAKSEFDEAEALKAEQAAAVKAPAPKGAKADN